MAVTAVRTVAVLLACVVGLTACGTEGGALSGTAVNDYDLSYDRIVIQRQESGGQPTAMIVTYVRDISSGVEKPVKVVTNWPLQEGVTKDLVPSGAGSVEHITVSGGGFPDLETGSITFDTLGGAGESASGKFFATFKNNGGTLNGEFSGTIELLKVN